MQFELFLKGFYFVIIFIKSVGDILIPYCKSNDNLHMIFIFVVGGHLDRRWLLQLKIISGYRRAV